MKKLDSVEQYNNLTREVHKECRRPYSNLYYTAEQIQRYIDLERAFFCNVEGGVIFLFDEELYYKLGLYLDGEKKFDFPQVDKKLLMRDIYREGKREKTIPCIEKRLQELGFIKAGTTAQVCARVEDLYERSRKAERYVKKMEDAGFHIFVADKTQIETIEKVLLDSNIIKDYHIEYRTVEEKLKTLEMYMGVVNKSNEICAVNVVSSSNGIIQGVGVAIQDEYKMSGLAPFMTYYRSNWLLEQGYKLVQGWILLTNRESFRYHTSIGYYLTDKRADEWVR